MGRKLKFDVRKRSSQKARKETRLTASNVKALAQSTTTVETQTDSPPLMVNAGTQTDSPPLMVNAGTQTDIDWFFDNKEVQTESEGNCTIAAVTTAIQTEPDVVLQVLQDNSMNQEVRPANDEVKCCEGIVDEKYASLIEKHNGLFKDSTGKQ